jgi:PEGA domain
MRINIIVLLLLTISAQQVAKAGQVVLTSDPPGATITAAGKQLGITPMAVDLPNGAVEITSHFGCLEPVAQTVNAEDGQVSAYNFKHSYGTLIIRSDSADANITIDGVSCGHGSALVFVTPGPHKILAKTDEVGERTQDVNVMDGQLTSVDLHFGGSQPQQVGDNSDSSSSTISTNLASWSKPSGKGSMSLVNATAPSGAPQWEEPSQQLLSPPQTPPAPSPSPSPVASGTPRAIGKTSSQAKPSKIVAHSQLKPEKADASSNQAVDPAKAKALVDAEWKAKTEALAAERERIDYGIKNSTGAAREEWKYKLALWKLEKRQAEPVRARAASGVPMKQNSIVSSTPTTKPDPVRARALLQAEWKAKSSALAAERQRIDYELKNSSGATRKQWEAKLVVWRREKAQAEQDEAAAKAALKESSN